MRVLALDISASQTGWAIYDPPRHVDMICGKFKCPGQSHEERARAMARELGSIFNLYKPKFLIHEMPLRSVQQYRKRPKGMLGDEPASLTINANTALVLNQLTGAAVGAAALADIPSIPIAVNSWRASVYRGMVTPKGGDSAAWKRLAREHCRALGILGASTHDEAEAALIALCAPGMAEYRMVKEMAA